MSTPNIKLTLTPELHTAVQQMIAKPNDPKISNLALLIGAMAQPVVALNPNSRK